MRFSTSVVIAVLAASTLPAFSMPTGSSGASKAAAKPAAPAVPPKPAAPAVPPKPVEPVQQEPQTSLSETIKNGAATIGSIGNLITNGINAGIAGQQLAMQQQQLAQQQAQLAAAQAANHKREPVSFDHLQSRGKTSDAIGSAIGTIGDLVMGGMGIAQKQKELEFQKQQFEQMQAQASQLAAAKAAPTANARRHELEERELELSALYARDGTAPASKGSKFKSSTFANIASAANDIGSLGIGIAGSVQQQQLAQQQQALAQAQLASLHARGGAPAGSTGSKFKLPSSSTFANLASAANGLGSLGINIANTVQQQQLAQQQQAVAQAQASALASLHARDDVALLPTTVKRFKFPSSSSIANFASAAHDLGNLGIGIASTVQQQQLAQQQQALAQAQLASLHARGGAPAGSTGSKFKLPSSSTVANLAQAANNFGSLGINIANTVQQQQLAQQQQAVAQAQASQLASLHARFSFPSLSNLKLPSSSSLANGAEALGHIGKLGLNIADTVQNQKQFDLAKQQQAQIQAQASQLASIQAAKPQATDSPKRRQLIAGEGLS